MATKTTGSKKTTVTGKVTKKVKAVNPPVEETKAPVVETPTSTPPAPAFKPFGETFDEKGFRFLVEVFELNKFYESEIMGGTEIDGRKVYAGISEKNGKPPKRYVSGEFQTRNPYFRDGEMREYVTNYGVFISQPTPPGKSPYWRVSRVEKEIDPVTNRNVETPVRDGIICKGEPMTGLKWFQK